MEPSQIVDITCFIENTFWLDMNSRSPLHRMPWWVLIWIQTSPLVFLVFSVACFSSGLVLLPYTSSQVRLWIIWCADAVILLSESCYMHCRDRLHGFHGFRFHSCVYLDGIRALGLESLSRPEMASWCAWGGRESPSPQSRNIKERKYHRWHIGFYNGTKVSAYQYWNVTSELC